MLCSYHKNERAEGILAEYEYVYYLDCDDCIVNTHMYKFIKLHTINVKFSVYQL
jgi:hypothetical protein